jgi:Plasmid pRiA4b ORF-3-like protein
LSVKKAPLPIYRLKITLIGIKPPIWRRMQCPASFKLCCLHAAIQIAMGWTDSHLHQWEKDGKNWGVPEWDEFDELDLIDESKTRLADVLQLEGDSIIYAYDFGDNWQHNVVLEKIIPVRDVVKAPICFGGERRCPPEDVGGVSGYEEFLEAIFDPQHENYEQYVRWAGGHFIDEFDLKAANGALSELRWPVRHRW